MEGGYQSETICFLCLKLNCYSLGDTKKADEHITNKRNVLQVKRLLIYLGLEADTFSLDGAEPSVCTGCSELLEQFAVIFKIWEEIDMKLTLLFVAPLAKQLDHSLRLQNVKLEVKTEDIPLTQKSKANHFKLQEDVRMKCE